jgi:hypothetical protein
MGIVLVEPLTYRDSGTRTRQARDLVINPGRWQDPLHYSGKANQHYQQLEQGCEPAIGSQSFDSPEANRSEYNDAQSAEQSRDHDDSKLPGCDWTHSRRLKP